MTVVDIIICASYNKTLSESTALHSDCC